MEEEQQQGEQQSYELAVCRQQAEEYLNNWKRERADFLNYKKDEVKRLEEFVKFANEAVILEMVEVLDDLEIARLNFAKQNLDGQAAQDGLAQVINKFMELLKKYGVERIKVENNFDPLLHEAVNIEESGLSGQENKMEEVRAGYMMYGKVIRPTRVKIIK